MADESAILEVPTSVTTDSTSGGTGSGGTHEPPDPGTHTGETQADGTGHDDGLGEDQDGSQLDEPAIQGTKLSAKAQEALNALRTTDPKLAAQFKQSLFTTEALKAIVPDGIPGVKALVESFEKYGGEQGITELRTNYDELKQIDDAFYKGDPAFVQKMIESAPDSFAKLVPSIIDQYRQLSPDGYDSMVCNAIVADMTGKQIPLFLQRCTDFMTDPKGIDALNKVIDYINGLGNIARQQVKPVAGKAAAAPDAERAQFETERANFQKDQFRASSNQIIQSVFPSEWARATAGLKLTAQQEMRAKQLFGTDLKLILQNLPKVGGKTFDEQVQAFYNAKDINGYKKFMTAAYSKHMPTALSNVLGDLGVAHRVEDVLEHPQLRERLDGALGAQLGLADRPVEKPDRDGGLYRRDAHFLCGVLVLLKLVGRHPELRRLIVQGVGQGEVILDEPHDARDRRAAREDCAETLQCAADRLGSAQQLRHRVVGRLQA